MNQDSAVTDLLEENERLIKQIQKLVEENKRLKTRVKILEDKIGE